MPPRTYRSSHSFPSGSPHNWSMGSPSACTSHSARSCRHAAPSCGHISRSHTLENKPELTTTGTLRDTNVWTLLLKSVQMWSTRAGIYLLLVLNYILGGVVVKFKTAGLIGFSESWTYLMETWRGHIQSGPCLRLERSPRDQQGWRCQNLTQDKYAQ